MIARLISIATPAALFCLWATAGAAQQLRIVSFTADGQLTWTGAFAGGTCTIEASRPPRDAWAPLQNVFTVDAAGQAVVTVWPGHALYRLLARDLSPTPQGFTNLCASYGLLQTIAGKGDYTTDGFNGWNAQFEGGPATAAELSRPHIAMADDAGNIYIADKDGQAIRKITPAGVIITVAGTNVAGDDGNTPGPGTQRRLSSPNGLWVRGDGTVYILDLGNSKIRRLGTDGILSTMFEVSDGINIGRGLWVKDDESLVYFASGTALRKWTPGGGVKTVASSFVELGNLIVDPSGVLVATDRGGNRVYQVSKGSKTPIAGNGDVVGGGDGSPALNTGLAGVRGIWFLPTGGYLLATHEGSQVWYVDVSGIIHLFLDGSPGAHAGDGAYFHTPGPKVSEVRAVTMDKQGRVIVTENDGGFVRTIDFLPMGP